jgi:hypothetical protein
MSTVQKIFITFLVFTFVLGLYITMYWNISVNLKTKENMETNSSCPNLLIKKGNMLLLYNKNKPEDETNPIPFFNLDEYINYLEIQKEKGIICPVLFLQEENNTQGENIYKVHPSPFELQDGVSGENTEDVIDRTDANRSNPPYNQDQYPGFDPQGQYIGKYTNIDAIHDSTNEKKISDNPMDSKWAGVTYTQQMVDTGKYAGRELTKPQLFNPKTAFYPSIPSEIPLPQDVLGYSTEGSH